jgi:Pyridoxamine 5'-phosphate oxidase
VASWREVEAEAPDLAARARALFDANKHKTLATLRRDGSPRISGIEIWFEDGELWFGSMWQGVKALDLQRDSRFALHSASDGEDFEGDAKVAGVAEETGSEDGGMHRFRADVTELVLISLAGEAPERYLAIESWHPGRGVTTRRRD